MFLAGALHLAVVAEHWAHAPAHGLFFLLAGVAQIGWSIAFWRTRSPGLARVGFVMALALIILWGVTRMLPAPFGHGPEAIDSAGLVTKLCEGVCAAALAALLTTTFTVQPGLRAWRPISGLILVSLLVAGLTYGAALAAEPLIPALAPPSIEEHEHAPQEQHEHAPPEEHEDEHDHSAGLFMDGSSYG
jgi:hypothetical protein